MDAGREKRRNVLPLVALACSLSSLVVLALSGVGTRLGLWHFRTGFAILKWGACLGLASAVFSIVAGAMCFRRGRKLGCLVTVLALVCGLAAFGLPYSWKLKAQKYPRIHDISTDLNNPPQFVALAPQRHGDVAYGGAEVAAQQLKGYPDLKTLVYNAPMPRAFQASLDVAKEMGWEIVAQVPAEGRIEATDTTRWFGFKDDIVIRIFPAGERSLVDLRSASRVGISDVGTNAARIRAFIAKLTHQPPQ